MWRRRLGLLVLLGGLLGAINRPVGAFEPPQNSYEHLGAVSYKISSERGLRPWVPYPILKPSDSLELTFDLLEEAPQELEYTILRYEANWQPSSLLHSEYLEGLAQREMSFGQPSEGTLMSYVQYHLSFPAGQLLLSGNYLLQVSSRVDGAIVLQFPFSLAEELVVPELELNASPWGGRWESHQGLSLRLCYRTLGGAVQNPEQEFKPIVLQGDRWDSSKWLREPLLEGQLCLSYTNSSSAVFEGGNGYHKLEHLEERSLGMGVEQISMVDDVYQMRLYPIENRSHLPYIYEPDQHGRQVINYSEYPLEEDYHRVLFRFRSKPLEEGVVLLHGEAFRYLPEVARTMSYHPEYGEYQLLLPVKEGYQEFQFLYKARQATAMNIGVTEGSHQETPNRYTTLVYYRGPTDRSDRLIGVNSIQVK